MAHVVNHKLVYMQRFGTNLTLCREQGNLVGQPIPVGPEYIYIALVEQGHNIYRIDGSDYEVGTGDMLVLIHTKSTVEENRSEDFCARIALLSRAYVQYLNIPNAYRMFLSLRRCPVLHLDVESQQQMGNCFNLISSTLRQENNSYRKHTIYYAVKTYLFTLAFLSQGEQSRIPSREEDMAMRFMDLLEENYRQEHSVAFYAEQMHLTPKYLSASVKIALGKPAIDCIAQRLMTQAQKMLSQPELTISEICYSLGFQSPSAFGKFFRTHTGIGPREWRQSKLTVD